MQCLDRFWQNLGIFSVKSRLDPHLCLFKHIDAYKYTIRAIYDKYWSNDWGEVGVGGGGQQKRSESLQLKLFSGLGPLCPTKSGPDQSYGFGGVRTPQPW